MNLFIDGSPEPQPRPRARVMRTKGKNPIASIYSPKSAWRTRVGRRLELRKLDPLEGPVEVVMFFRLPRPKSHYRTGRNAHLLRDSAPQYPGRADVDNLAKAVLDEMNQRAFHDDAQVVGLVVRKRYAKPGEEPGVDLRWHPLEPGGSFPE